MINGPYGRCVYECDNDVLDNQVVNMLFEDGITVSFSMVAFTERLCQRQTRIFGTKGELTGNGHDKIKVFDFLTRKKTLYVPDTPFKTSGHGGGDFGLMDDFISSVLNNDPSYLKSSPLETLMSHLVVFTADEARTNSSVTKIDNFDCNDW